MAGLILDTPVFLWWINNASDLSTAARHGISDSKNDCFLSIASCWEMAIKASLGKLKLPNPIERFVSEQLRVNDFKLLAIDIRHVAKTEKLPFYHRDPIDRLLIAQALTEKLTIVAADNNFKKYGVKILW
jgi:PIN domain nuclease of toxin-antitoxin system